MIDENGHARLADFGLLTIVSNPAYFTPSSSIVTCGTIRWMSPELLRPDRFGLKDSRPTKESDYYALGMVIYEVLSGKVPFAGLKDFIVIPKVVEGELPERPEGREGLWFTDDLWEMLNRCWATEPKSRPGVRAVSECLDQVSKTWKPPSQQIDEDVEPDEDDWNPSAVVLSVWFSVFIPLASCSHGGFCTDHASNPLLESTPLGTQPSLSRRWETFSRTPGWEVMGVLYRRCTEGRHR